MKEKTKDNLWGASALFVTISAIAFWLMVIASCVTGEKF